MAKYTAKRNFSSQWQMVLKGDTIDIDNQAMADEYLRLGLVELYKEGQPQQQEIIVVGRDTGKPNRKNTRRK